MNPIEQAEQALEQTHLQVADSAIRRQHGVGILSFIQANMAELGGIIVTLRDLDELYVQVSYQGTVRISWAACGMSGPALRGDFDLSVRLLPQDTQALARAGVRLLQARRKA